MVDSAYLFRRLRGLRAAFFLAACAAAAPVRAQDVTIVGVARSVSLMRQIVATCGTAFDVDADLASRAEKSFVQAGEKLYGGKAFDAAVAAELQRRAEEVRTTGSDRWCADQRERLKDMPGKKIFRK